METAFKKFEGIWFALSSTNFTWSILEYLDSFDLVCILYSPYFVLFSDVDKYGFERGEDFDYESYEEFMSEYLPVLTRRLAKWEKLLKSEDGVNRSRKGNANPTVKWILKVNYKTNR